MQLETEKKNNRLNQDQGSVTTVMYQMEQFEVFSNFQNFNSSILRINFPFMNRRLPCKIEQESACKSIIQWAKIITAFIIMYKRGFYTGTKKIAEITKIGLASRICSNAAWTLHQNWTTLPLLRSPVNSGWTHQWEMGTRPISINHPRVHAALEQILEANPIFVISAIFFVPV